MTNRNKLHYAWIDMAIVCLITMCMGAQTMSQSVFLLPLRESLGVKTGTLSFAFSLPSLVYIFMAPVYAKVFNNRSIKVLSLCLLFFQALSLLIISYSQNIYEVYFSYILFGLCFNCSLSMLPALVVKRWFKSKSNFALSVMITFSMIGGTIFSPIASFLIETYNFRIAYRTLFMFIMFVNIPLVFLFLKNKPSDINLKPYEIVDNRTINLKGIKNTNELTSKIAWKTKLFILTSLYYIVIQYCACMEQHIVNMVVSLGYSASQGATIVTCCFVGGLIARILLSIFNDKIGIKNTTLIFSSIGAISCVLMILFGKLNFMLLCIVGFLFGSALKSGLVQSSSMCHEVYGDCPEYAKIYGNILMVGGIVVASSSYLMGTLYDAYGTYYIQLVIMLVLYVISIPLSIKIISKKSKGELYD